MKRSKRIRILPEETVNKVAAGEVVERPAAALKELIENSLDAGAGQIDVALENAGRTLIRVRDDGEGMTHDEVLLAIERHSTSKISRVEDLAGIATFGFRGEALPSLAAVSRLQLTTRTRGEDEGTRVVIDCGRVRKVTPWGAPAGTEVEVRSLFRNVPARLKFLKSRATELSHCVSTATRLALANPSTGLHLAHGGRTLVRLAPAADFTARLTEHLGPEFFAHLLPFTAEAPPLSLRGFIARPGTGRAGSEYQQIFVNRRPVRDALLARAVREAGGEYFLKEKAPLSYFIWIDLPPADVDVNVHPTKREVRFRDPAGLRSLLRPALQQTLREDRLRAFRIPSPGAGDPAAREAPAPYDAGPSVAEQLPLRHSMAAGEEADYEPISSSGQLFATYLVSLRPDGLVLVDQHAAHERVLFERTLALLNSGSMQKLLHPLHLDLGAAEVEILEELLPELEKSGVEIQRFGARSFRLTGMPLELSEEGAAAFVRDLIERVRTGEATPAVPDFRRHLAAVIACHGSVRANQKLSPEEARSLLRDLFRTGDPAHCPHGRPTFIRLEREEIEKRFKRS